MSSSRWKHLPRREALDALPAPESGSTPGPALAIALGGGGARGFAHVLMLEALDELGSVRRSSRGTSIGSLIGAAYASGMSGAEIRVFCQELFFRSAPQIVKRLFTRWNTPQLADCFAAHPAFRYSPASACWRRSCRKRCPPPSRS